MVQFENELLKMRCGQIEYRLQELERRSYENRLRDIETRLQYQQPGFYPGMPMYPQYPPMIPASHLMYPPMGYPQPMPYGATLHAPPQVLTYVPHNPAANAMYTQHYPVSNYTANPQCYAPPRASRHQHSNHNFFQQHRDAETRANQTRSQRPGNTAVPLPASNNSIISGDRAPAASLNPPPTEQGDVGETLGDVHDVSDATLSDSASEENSPTRQPADVKNTPIGETGCATGNHSDKENKNSAKTDALPGKDSDEEEKPPSFLAMNKPSIPPDPKSSLLQQRPSD